MRYNIPVTCPHCQETYICAGVKKGQDIPVHSCPNPNCRKVHSGIRLEWPKRKHRKFIKPKDDWKHDGF